MYTKGHEFVVTADRSRLSGCECRQQATVCAAPVLDLFMKQFIITHSCSTNPKAKSAYTTTSKFQFPVLGNIKLINSVRC
jgi:hypothetical protein